MAISRILAGLILGGCTMASAWATAPQERARVWRDQQGNEVVGRVVGIQGNSVILRSDGRDIAIDISELSTADQNYLQGKQFAGDPTPSPSSAHATSPRQTPQPPAPPPAGEPREWTVGDKGIVGGWLGADEEAFYIQTASGETRIAYAAISSAADAKEVSARLAAAGREDLAQQVAAFYERNTGKSLIPAAAGDPNPAGADDAEPPFNQDVNVATEPTDWPARPEKVDIATADELFAEGKDAAPSDAALRTRNRVLLGAFALVALVSAVLTYGWMSTKRS